MLSILPAPVTCLLLTRLLPRQQLLQVPDGTTEQALQGTAELYVEGCKAKQLQTPPAKWQAQAAMAQPHQGHLPAHRLTPQARGEQEMLLLVICIAGMPAIF